MYRSNILSIFIKKKVTPSSGAIFEVYNEVGCGFLEGGISGMLECENFALTKYPFYLSTGIAHCVQRENHWNSSLSPGFCVL